MAGREASEDCWGSLQTVLENLRSTARLGTWPEVTTLIVPGLSDDAADLEHMAQFIANELGQDTPWHLLRFYPNYLMRDRLTTSQDQLQMAVASGQRGWAAVYLHERTGARRNAQYRVSALPNCDNSASRLSAGQQQPARWALCRMWPIDQWGLDCSTSAPRAGLFIEVEAT